MVKCKEVFTTHMLHCVWNIYSTYIWLRFIVTLPETNSSLLKIDPLLKKEIPIGNHHF